jgi:VanZ family protein
MKGAGRAGRAALKAVLAAYMLLILFLSIMPKPGPLPEIWRIDKLYHFLAYAVMGFLWVWTLRGRARPAWRADPAWRATRRIVIAAFVISTLFGVAMEVLQHFAPLRSLEVMDAVANALGALLGAMVAGRALKVWGRGRYDVKTPDN